MCLGMPSSDWSTAAWSTSTIMMARWTRGTLPAGSPRHPSNVAPHRRLLAPLAFHPGVVRRQVRVDRLRRGCPAHAVMRHRKPSISGHSRCGRPGSMQGEVARRSTKKGVRQDRVNTSTLSPLSADRVARALALESYAGHHQAHLAHCPATSLHDVRISLAEIDIDFKDF